MKVQQLILDILTFIGYTPIIDDSDYRICVSFTSFGADSFSTKQKDLIQTVADGQLSEFYYESNTQYIYLKK